MGATGDKCLLIEKYTNSSCPVFGPCLIPPPASIATKLPISGSITKNVINTTKYSMVCLFPEVDGSIQKSIVVNIDPNPISPVVTTFAASPASIMPGQSSTLTWASTNADKCSIDGVDKLANGSMSVSPTSTTTYKILCSKGTVDSPSKSVAITINTTVPSELSEIAKTKLNTWITKNITVRSTTLTSSNYVKFIEMVITKLNVIKANTPSSNKSKINTINYIVLELGKILSSIDDNSFLDDLLK